MNVLEALVVLAWFGAVIMCTPLGTPIAYKMMVRFHESEARIEELRTQLEALKAEKEAAKAARTKR